MLNKNIETFLGCDKEYDEARIVIFGAPFDSTTSYRPGTRFASKEMRSQSFGMETYSPYQDLDLCDAGVFDGGDLELCFGDTKLALADIERCAARILEDGKLPLMIGGEHLVTLGAVRAAHVARHDDREEQADDRQHHHQLDQSESSFSHHHSLYGMPLRPFASLFE
jgi:agmatinase